MRAGDTVRHPVDGVFTIEDTEPPHGVWPQGRAKRTDGRWYPIHTLERLAARYKCGSEVMLGDVCSKGTVTHVYHALGRLRATDSRVDWPADMVSLEHRC